MVITLTDRAEFLKALSKPIPYKWRIQSVSKNKPQATCVAYIDARDVADVLDQYCVEGWQNEYREVAGNLFCGIGIRINGEWEWRWDCGVESNTEKEKGRASDAFKRAAVKWGVGRFLYDLGFQYVTTNEAKTGNNQPYPVENGNRIWDLTKYFNHKLKPVQESKQAFSNKEKPVALSAKPAEEKPLSTSEIVKRKLESKVSRFRRGQEWLEASLKGQGISYETMTKAQFEDFKKIISELNDSIIEVDLSVLKPPSSIGNALAGSNPEKEIKRVLERLAPLSDTDEVSISDIVTLAEYAKFKGFGKEVEELEDLLDSGESLKKIVFLAKVVQLQSTKNN